MANVSASGNEFNGECKIVGTETVDKSEFVGGDKVEIARSVVNIFFDSARPEAKEFPKQQRHATLFAALSFRVSELKRREVSETRLRDLAQHVDGCDCESNEKTAVKH